MTEQDFRVKKLLRRNWYSVYHAH